MTKTESFAGYCVVDAKRNPENGTSQLLIQAVQTAPFDRNGSANIAENDSTFNNLIKQNSGSHLQSVADWMRMRIEKKELNSALPNDKQSPGSTQIIGSPASYHEFLRNSSEVNVNAHWLQSNSNNGRVTLEELLTSGQSLMSLQEVAGMQITTIPDESTQILHSEQEQTMWEEEMDLMDTSTSVLQSLWNYGNASDEFILTTIGNESPKRLPSEQSTYSDELQHVATVESIGFDPSKTTTDIGTPIQAKQGKGSLASTNTDNGSIHPTKAPLHLNLKNIYRPNVSLSIPTQSDWFNVVVDAEQALQDHCYHKSTQMDTATLQSRPLPVSEVRSTAKVGNNDYTTLQPPLELQSTPNGATLPLKENLVAIVPTSEPIHLDAQTFTPSSVVHAPTPFPAVPIVPSTSGVNSTAKSQAQPPPVSFSSVPTDPYTNQPSTSGINSTARIQLQSPPLSEVEPTATLRTAFPLKLQQPPVSVVKSKIPVGKTLPSKENLARKNAKIQAPGSSARTAPYTIQPSTSEVNSTAKRQAKKRPHQRSEKVVIHSDELVRLPTPQPVGSVIPTSNNLVRIQPRQITLNPAASNARANSAPIAKAAKSKLQPPRRNPAKPKINPLAAPSKSIPVIQTANSIPVVPKSLKRTNNETISSNETVPAKVQKVKQPVQITVTETAASSTSLNLTDIHMKRIGMVGEINSTATASELDAGTLSLSECIKLLQRNNVSIFKLLQK